ncbi:MAG: DNA topoisomerase 3 [Verrucomicrobiae bacterium]|nr:DNA topoisomerase 3 [Verrucomicrobiae bacterium]
MGKALIITEKPSVAADIAAALGKFKKHKDYYENDAYVLSWAVGHLFELAVPEAFKESDKWDLQKLPILPPHFDLAPQPKTQNRVKVLEQLLRRRDITEVINACDAGREGELIFRYIIQHAEKRGKLDKPIRRLWLQSMTREAIREGFTQLRTDEEMQPLASAARCRNEADWLVGINATRAFTLRLRRGKGTAVTTLGRVQTPTLAIIVDREEKIERFRPREVLEVVAQFQAACGEYSGRWFDEGFQKNESERDRTRRLLAHFGLNVPDAESRLEETNGSLWDEHRAAYRLWHRELAEAIRQRCAGQPGVVEVEEKKPTTQSPPALYDLTSLQRDANARHGFSARQTLQAAQALYEKHKLITYPRTDSRCLPEDYLAVVKKTLRMLGPLAEKVLANDWVKPNKRIFNNAKVGDHFAIIPTGREAGTLDDTERTVYELIVKRFIAAFYPAAQFEATTRITRVAGEPFKTEGKILIEPGWLEVYGKQEDKEGETSLPAVRVGETVKTQELQIKSEQTKPPPRYTEATILSAMEGAGKLVEDEELAEAMKERGLGTPATRAQIIENLVAVKYLMRRGKELVPTDKAKRTIALLRKVAPDLVSPEMTGEWEFKLREIEHRRLDRDRFMEDIRELTRHIVEEARAFNPDEHVDETPFGECPKCRSPLRERYDRFVCTRSDCDFNLWKTLAGRSFSRAEVDQLIRDRKLGPLDGFMSKNRRPFSAVVRLTDDYKVEFDFEATNEAARTGIPCKKCEGQMVIRRGRRGEFLSCSRYPDCDFTLNFRRDEQGRIVTLPPAPETTIQVTDVCDECKAPMTIRRSRRGPFLSCSRYPECKFAKPLTAELREKLKTARTEAIAATPSVPVDKLCPQCGAPLVRRQGRFGEFLACSTFPKCKHVEKTLVT